MTTTTTKRALIALAAVAAMTAVGYGAYTVGMRQGMSHAGAAGAAPTAAGGAVEGEAATRRHIEAGLKAGDVDPASGRRILYYQDPMVPGRRFEAPGKSPFMDMMLVPVYAGSDAADTSSVSVSPRVQQNLGLRTAEVSTGELAPQVAAVGNVAWNERDQVALQARAAGFVEKLNVRATLDRVAAGQVLAEIYVPDWVAVQEEFLFARRLEGELGPKLAEAARARMRQAGMSESQIERVAAGGTLQPRFAVVAPQSGVIAELGVREGMAVAMGAPLFRIQGTGSVWAQAQVPETQAALLAPGQRVSVRSPALGSAVEGRVLALLPEADLNARTVTARVELPNRQGRLVPGLSVQLDFAGAAPRRTLLVPSEALIHTGERTLVMLAEGEGRYRPVTVTTGLESGGRTEIRSGLQAGQQVVVSSQFLVDSEASLRGLEARLNAGAAGASTTHRVDAKVEALSGDDVTLTHGPVPSLKWPEMTMDFRLPPAAARPRGLAVGDRVAIEFAVEGDAAQIRSMRRLDAGAGHAGHGAAAAAANAAAGAGAASGSRR